MTLLVWKDAYRLGDPAIDHEHRELIDLINALHDQLGKEGAAMTVPSFLGEIYAAISAHFALEEKLMRERRYDQLGLHKEDHEHLLDDLRDIMDEVEDGLDDARVAGRLDTWFSTHFRTHDARLHRVLGPDH